MEFPRLADASALAYDTETTGLIYPRDRVFGIAVAVEDEEWYWDVREVPQAIRWWNDTMARYKGIIICHNGSFDAKMSIATGIDLPLELIDDTVIRATQIDEHLLTYDLDSLGKKYLGATKDSDIYAELAELFGGKATRTAQMANLQRAPSDIVGRYARQDVRLTYDLWCWQRDEVARQSMGRHNLQDILDFERRVFPTVVRTELRGVRVDLAVAEQAIEQLTPIIDQNQSRLNELAGSAINVNSAPQIKKMFDPKQGDDGEWYVGDVQIGKTGKGAPSLKAEYLREVAEHDERASLVQEVRSLIKTRDTFLAGHIIGHSHDGRVYPNINQTKSEDGGTGTGRFSYTSPALQQIPSRNKRVAAICKPCFLPDEGEVWVDGDMASFEVRVFAHLINIASVIQAYVDNPELDFHGWVADETGLVRNAEYSGQPNAKQLNLSAIFNSGNGAIAQAMGMPWSWDSFEAKDGKTVTYKKAGVEAMEVINRYHRKLPGVKQLAKGCKDVAESRGYIVTGFGRRLRFPRKYKTYKASGLLIQATSADLNKENWLLAEEAIGDRGRLVLNTHDSYGMSLQEDTWRDTWQDVKASIERPGRIRVPLLLELSGMGHNWWDAINGTN